MDCVSFSKAFQSNMNALGLPAPYSLFSSLTTALGSLGAMLNAFKSVPPTATVAEVLGATFVKEKLDVVGVLATSYYVGAVIGSIIVASDSERACKDSYRNTPLVKYRAFFSWMASRGVLIPMDMQVFILNNPEVIAGGPKQKSYAMRARQYGAK
ncbi:hypothetical protein LMG24076_01359 [Trinickia soli]|uniref:Uncharacterized protein n=2 Tax=Trinickia soli TaxID=380675 RepID=A0A2N7WE69_9BURK|nr:hypothetical protein C0Z19_03175 [Trinickia soli]CAB3659214.1 hypothetical protein LMG24076_01359 [Trinickia soli]